MGGIATFADGDLGGLARRQRCLSGSHIQRKGVPLFETRRVMASPGGVRSLPRDFFAIFLLVRFVRPPRPREKSDSTVAKFRGPVDGTTPLGALPTR
jgi:hypothetical protein